MSLVIDNSSSLHGRVPSSSSSPFALKPSWTVGDSRQPLPTWWLPVYFALLVVSLALPRRDRITYTVPAVVGLVAMLVFHTEGSFKKDFDLGNLALGWFFFYLGLCFGTPEREFWRRDGRDIKPEEREAEIKSASLLSRLRWSFEIWTNPRGVGWSHEAPGLKRETAGRWTFVAKKMANALVLSIVWDCLHLWYKTLLVNSATQPWTIYQYPLYLQILLGVSNQFRIYCEIVSMHSIAAAFTVGVGLYTPKDWPPLVGSFADAYTCARFWGRVWHQLMRQVADDGGKLISSVSPFPKRSAMSRLLYLVGAFATTGLYHNVVNIFATGFRAGLHPCGDMAFILMGIAVFIETYAIKFVKETGHASNVTGWRIFGYLWTAAAIGWVEIGWVDGLAKAGVWNVDLKLLNHFGLRM